MGTCLFRTLKTLTGPCGGEGYSVGDMAVYEWRRDSAEKRVVWGKPLDQREEDESVPLLGITGAAHVKGANGVLFVSAIYEDTYGLVYLDLDHPQQVEKVQVSGGSFRRG
jgi:hypothetical protein